ncbi:uncharacterized protein LOC105432474 [Pogonomyrmex barbatus]|uniref:Uncharacterized protein LOC105432474 n=1 Tax=Pogonomyrmex barbatus TaxID=144034 RepID=A0A8N1SBB2_9HYME|nr:uncharacterized protein LOC105432474 [Pogonomyrmex barbatus]
MKLIRDKKLFREDFFKEMRTLFIYVAKKLCSDDRLPHWELLMDAYSEIMSQNSTSETEYLITNKLSQKELITENNELTSQENKLFFIDLKNYDSGNSMISNLQKKSPTSSKIFLTTKNSQTNTSGNAKIKSSNLNPSDVLNIIVKATYSMYANELRYFLIYEVFVKQIQLQIFHMPHTFRTARQIKLADSEKGLFHVKLRERLKKIASESIINDNDEQYNEEKTIDNTKEEKEEKMKDLDMEIPPTPQSSLMEDELLANNHRFILPLIEANEAAQIFEMHAGNI